MASGACCRCNRKGLCKGCSCVKAGRSCSGCLPGRLGQCSNPAPALVPPATPALVPPDILVPPAVPSSTLVVPSPARSVSSSTRPVQESSSSNLFFYLFFFFYKSLCMKCKGCTHSYELIFCTPN